MHGSFASQVASGLVGGLIGLGTWWLMEVGLCLLARAGLFPLPTLRRWKLVDPLLSWPRLLLLLLGTTAVVGWLVGKLGPVPLMPECISMPLGLSLENGSMAVIFGIAVGLNTRSFFDCTNPYDGPPLTAASDAAEPEESSPC